MDFKDILSKENTTKVKSKKIINNIISDYKKGIIKTETELSYRIKKDLIAFYNSIYKPSFVPYYAIGSPNSDYMNEMFETMYNDIKSIIDESLNTSYICNGEFNSFDITEENLSNMARICEKTVLDLKDSIYAFTSNKTGSYTNSFNSGQDSNDTANLDSKQGILTLPYNNFKNYTKNCKVEVLESNGLPGNTHVATSKDKNVIYDGENNPAVNIRNILNESKDSRFEYEIFNVSDEVYDKCNGAGFTYSEGVSWITDDNKLTLKIRITLDKDNKCNWFSIDPYLANSNSFSPAVIKNILISDGYVSIQNLTLNRAFDDVIILNFKEQVVRYIDIEFEQTVPYKTDVAHDVAIKPYLNKSIYSIDSNDVYDRVDKVKPSISALGVSYNPKKQTIVHPDSSKQAVSNDEVYDSLFSLYKDDSGYIYSKEIISAYRYSIGIKSIKIGNYTFEEKGVYKSELYTTDKEINSITLYASDYIPNVNTDVDCIGYYLTFDNGITYVKINPKNEVYRGHCTVEINSDTPIYARDRHTIYIDRLLETKSVGVKIELCRPNEDTHNTPIVFNYRLDITTGGGKFDY